MDPGGIAIDRQNNLFIADSGDDLVEKVTPQGQLSIIAGEIGGNGAPVGGPATQSPLNSPQAIAVDADDNVYVGSWGGTGRYAFGHEVSEISPQGQLSVVAGNGIFHAPKLGVQATDSPLGPLTSLTVNAAGKLYIGSANPTPQVAPIYFAVLELNDAGGFTQVSESVYHASDDRRGCGPFESDYALAFGPNDNAYMNTASCVVRVTPQGGVSVIARTYSK